MSIRIHGQANRPIAVSGVQIPTLPELPSDWAAQINATARRLANVRMLPLNVASISREDDNPGKSLATVAVRGTELVEALPWVEEFYYGRSRDLVEALLKRPAICLDDLDEGIYVNILGVGMRFEHHTDFWRYNGVIFTQAPTHGGGELVLANNLDSSTYDQTCENPAAVIEPKAGTMAFLAAQNIPHVVKVIEKDPSQLEAELEPAENPSEGIFETPDITTDEFWKTARIAVNFAYSDQEFNDSIGLGSKEVFGVANFVHGRPQEPLQTSR